MVLLVMSWHCGFAAGAATASHWEMFAQHGRDCSPIGAIGVMATARRGTFCSAAYFHNKYIRFRSQPVCLSLMFYE